MRSSGRAAVALLMLCLSLGLFHVTALPSTAADRGGTAKSGGPDGESRGGAERGGGGDIAGGYFPAPTAWPWVTALIDHGRTAIAGDLGRQFCTGTLIAPDRVLTAAHCVLAGETVSSGLGTPLYRMEALIGRRDLTQVGEGERRRVTGVAVHPNAWLPKSGPYANRAFFDIAVLFLDQPAATQPATLGTSADWNTWATTMGFGHFNTDHTQPQTDGRLRAADFDLLTDQRCAPAFDWTGLAVYNGAIHACVDNAPGVPPDCITHGDSGGPLMVQAADLSWRLIGVTSFFTQRPSTICGGVGGPFGYAWAAGDTIRSWIAGLGRPSTSSRPWTRRTSVTTPAT